MVALREIRTQVLPAVRTELPVDTVALDLGFVTHELFRRACRVLDFEDDAVAGPFLRDGLVTERTRCHGVVIVTLSHKYFEFSVTCPVCIHDMNFLISGF